MNKQLKTLLIVIAIILVPVAGGIGYWYLTRKKSEDGSQNSAGESADKNTTPTTAGTSAAKPADTTATNNSFPLTLNPSVKSDLVKQCQELLNDKISGAIPPMAPIADGKYITSLVEDGYYGNKTAAAVKYEFPDTDGKTITQTMFNKLTGKREPGSYIRF